MGFTKKSLATAYAGHFFRYACIIFLIPFYARVLGPEEYGKVLLASALGGFVWIAQNWGFSVYGARSIALCKNQDQRQKEFSRQLTARCLMLPISILIGLIGTYISPALRADPVFGILATIWGILAGCNLGWYFQGLHDFKTSVKAEVIGFGLTFTLALITVTATGRGEAAMTSLVFASIVSTAYAYARARQTALLKTTHVRDGAKLIKESAPFFVNTAATTALATGGGYILGLFASPAQIAIYGIAERITTTILGMLAPASQVMLPILASLKSDPKNQASFEKSKDKATKLVILFGILTAAAAYTLPEYFLPALLGPNFTESSEILKIFSPLFFLYALNHTIIVYQLLPQNKEKVAATIMLMCSALSISLTYFLAQGAGARGVACARVLAELTATALLLIALRVLKRKQP